MLCLTGIITRQVTRILCVLSNHRGKPLNLEKELSTILSALARGMCGQVVELPFSPSSSPFPAVVPPAGFASSFGSPGFASPYLPRSAPMTAPVGPTSVEQQQQQQEQQEQQQQQPQLEQQQSQQQQQQQQEQQQQQHQPPPQPGAVPVGLDSSPGERGGLSFTTRRFMVAACGCGPSFGQCCPVNTAGEAQGCMCLMLHIPPPALLSLTRGA
jgi:hypothetical protein